MSVRPIVLLGDPRLRLRGETVDSFGKHLHELLDDLTDSMRHAPGVGLAAPQLGEPLRACVIEVEDTLYELVNPQIVRAHGDDRDLEGCLSIPGYVAYVTRHEKVWVVAQNRAGQEGQGRRLGPARPGAPARAGPPRRQAVHRLPRLDGRADRRRAGRRGRRRGPRGDERPRVSARPGRPTTGASGRSSSGSGAFAVPALERLAANPLVRLVAVVTAMPKRAGRDAGLDADPGRRVRPGARTSTRPHAAAAAPSRRDRGDPRAPAGARRPGRLRPDRAAGAARPPHGALNLHPSALPRFRGASPVPAAILAGDPSTAVTLMRMDPGLDTGPIVAQVPVAARRHRDGPGAGGAPRRGRARTCWTGRSARGSRASCVAVPQSGRRRRPHAAAPARGRPPGPGAARRRARAHGPRLRAVAGHVPRPPRRPARRDVGERRAVARPATRPGPSSRRAASPPSRRPTAASCSTR